jgi:hypothetical protein
MKVELRINDVTEMDLLRESLVKIENLRKARHAAEAAKWDAEIYAANGGAEETSPTNAFGNTYPPFTHGEYIIVPTEIVTDLSGAQVEVEIHPDEIRARQTEATIIDFAAKQMAATIRADQAAVKPETMETALRAYALKHGLGGARALLDKVGISQLGKATPEQLAALAAEIGA